MQAFLVDYSLHRLELLRELKTVVSPHALSVDLQPKGVKKVKHDFKSGELGGQAYTIFSDLVLI